MKKMEKKSKWESCEIKENRGFKVERIEFVIKTKERSINEEDIINCI